MVSYGWASFRIVTGTILGGVLGFYVMHKLELSYKERMKQELLKYEEEVNRKHQLNQEQDLSDS